MNTIVRAVRSAEPAPPWGLGAVALTIVAAFVLIILGTIVAAAWLGDPVSGSIPPLGQLVGWLIAGVFTAIFVLQTRRAAADRTAMRWAPGSAPLPLILFLAFGAAVAVDLLSVLITGVSTVPPELASLNRAAAGFREWAVAIALMVVVQPVADELVFRGVAFPVLRALAGGVGGWLLSAILYGAFHLLAFTPGIQGGIAPVWYGFVVPFIDGLIFGAVRAATGSTQLAAAAHAAFGLFALSKFLLLSA